VRSGSDGPHSVLLRGDAACLAAFRSGCVGVTI
jgi:hypothetical protein